MHDSGKRNIKRDRSNENFAKATRSLLGRCDDVRSRYSADVYILIRRRSKHYEYTSSEASSWPTSRDEIAVTFPTPVRLTPASIAGYCTKRKATIGGSSGVAQRSNGERAIPTEIEKDVKS
ncbi:hypothetical protein TruAng_012313 [Truncatella angustata]|nr:hypothetical protein TruAng_012313 [Truncatella angustata]